MAIFAKGADPEVLDASSERFTHYGSEAEQIRAAVSRLFDTLGSSWGGPDSAHFRKQAPVVDDRLGRCADTLMTLGKRLRDNAGAQRIASSSLGGPGTGTGPAGGPPASGPSVSTSSGYQVGPPVKPTFHWDEDFAYDTASPNWKDYLHREEWKAKLLAGQVARPDLDDALAAYKHYWDNDGRPLEVDYDEAYREDPAIRDNVNAEVGRTSAAVDELARSGQTQFEVTGPGHGSDRYPTTENWQKTLGAYQQWSSGNVSVKDGMVTMTVTVHAEDHYNFNRGAADIASGAPDNENGRFTELGWAKPFDTHGQVTRTLTWPVGHPPTQVDVGTGDESRNPGREDRTDNRGNPDSRPGGDRDTGDAGSNW